MGIRSKQNTIVFCEVAICDMKRVSSNRKTGKEGKERCLVIFMPPFLNLSFTFTQYSIICTGHLLYARYYFLSIGDRQGLSTHENYFAMNK